MVDVAAQNLLCAAPSTKSDENAYLSAMCAAFVKRIAYEKVVLKVDPEPALKLLADKVRACADGIQLKVETAPRFSSQSIVSVGRAQDAVEGQIRCLWLKLETRLSIEATPVMDVRPWLVRHAGWLLERYHVKGNTNKTFEDCGGKPYQGEVMKFAEAALFRVVEGREMESERVEQTRDLSVAYGLARPRNSMNISSRRGHRSVHHEDSETSSRHRAKTCRFGEEFARDAVG